MGDHWLGLPSKPTERGRSPSTLLYEAIEQELLSISKTYVPPVIEPQNEIKTSPPSTPAIERTVTFVPAVQPAPKVYTPPSPRGTQASPTSSTTLSPSDPTSPSNHQIRTSPISLSSQRVETPLRRVVSESNNNKWTEAPKVMQQQPPSSRPKSITVSTPKDVSNSRDVSASKVVNFKDVPPSKDASNSKDDWHYNRATAESTVPWQLNTFAKKHPDINLDAMSNYKAPPRIK